MSALDEQKAFIAYYATPRALFPILPPPLFIDGPDRELTFKGLNVAGIPQFIIPDGYSVDANQQAKAVVDHEAGHAFKAILERLHPGVDYGALYVAFRGFVETWDELHARASALYEAGQLNAAHAIDPDESWAEAFANAVIGRVVTTGTIDEGKTLDALAARAFFLSLVAPSMSAPPPVDPLTRAKRIARDAANAIAAL